MTIDNFREQIAILLGFSTQIESEVLDSLNPGIYGAEGTNMSILDKDIFVVIPNKTFTFKNLHFSSKVRVGGSRDEDSMLVDFSTTVKGHGSFDYESSKKIKLDEIEIDEISNTDVFE